MKKKQEDQTYRLNKTVTAFMKLQKQVWFYLLYCINMNLKYQINFFWTTFIFIFLSYHILLDGLSFMLCLGLFFTNLWEGDGFFSGVSPYKNLYRYFYFSSFLFAVIATVVVMYIYLFILYVLSAAFLNLVSLIELWLPFSSWR